MAYDENKIRKMTKAEWIRAIDIAKIFRIKKQKLIAMRFTNGQQYWVCHARGANAQDEQDRPTIDTDQAAWYVDTMKRFHASVEECDLLYQDLTKYLQGHVFYFNRTANYSWCSCYAWPEFRRCKHVVGLGIFTGRIPVPADIDTEVLIRVP